MFSVPGGPDGNIDHQTWLGLHGRRGGYRTRWQAFFHDWDILLCPIAPTDAFPHDHSPMESRTLSVNGEPRGYLEQIFWAGLATLSYLPGTVFPTGLSSNGLPIGLQAIGGAFDDRTTVEFARLMAQEMADSCHLLGTAPDLVDVFRPTVRIPPKLNTDSGKVNADSDERERSSERSDDYLSVSSIIVVPASLSPCPRTRGCVPGRGWPVEPVGGVSRPKRCGKRGARSVGGVPSSGHDWLSWQFLDVTDTGGHAGAALGQDAGRGVVHDGRVGRAQLVRRRMTRRPARSWGSDRPLWRLPEHRARGVSSAPVGHLSTRVGADSNTFGTLDTRETKEQSSLIDRRTCQCTESDSLGSARLASLFSRCSPC